MARRDYVFDEEKKFPVYDVEHERRAWAYVKAGRISIEQIPEVVVYLAENASDLKVRQEAAQAWEDWSEKGRGQVRETIDIIEGRVEKLRRNAQNVTVDLYIDDDKTLIVTPTGAGPDEDYRRELSFAIARQYSGEERAEAIMSLWDDDPALGSVKGFRESQRVLKEIGIDKDDLEDLEAGVTLQLLIPVRMFEKILTNTWGVKAL